MFQLLGLYMGSLLLRSIGIALFAALLCWRIRNVAIRHAVWVAVLGAMMLMPAVDFLLPPSWVPVRIRQIAAEQPTAFRNVSAKAVEAPQTLLPENSLPAQPKPVDWWQVAAMLYVVVAAAMFVRLAVAYRKLLKLRRVCNAVSSSVWDEITASRRACWRIPILMESECAHIPMTIGFLRPAVILPIDWRSWDEGKLQVVLLHETAHIRRGDWGIALVAAAAKCAYWLNPLSWFLERKLSLLAEQSCDDATLIVTVDLTYYAEILLEFAATTQNGGRLMKGGVAMAHPRIQERIERVLGMPHMGTGIVKTAGWIVVLIAAAPVIYSAAALQVRSEPAKVSAATYAAEFRRNSVPQEPTTGLEGALPSVSSTDSRRLYKQMELTKQQLQDQEVELQVKLQSTEQNGNPTSNGPQPLSVPTELPDPHLREIAMLSSIAAAELSGLEHAQQTLQQELKLLQAAKSGDVEPTRDQLRFLEYDKYIIAKRMMGRIAAEDVDSKNLIKPNDLLQILVQGISELTLKVAVEPNGRISIPLVKNITAAGLTPFQLKQELDKHLKDYAMPESVVIVIDSK